MNRLTFGHVALIVAGAAAMFGCGGVDPPMQTTPPAFRYLALGDSYTIGESVDPVDRWPLQLVAMLKGKGIVVAEPEIIAKTGWTTDELSSAIDAASPQGPYDLVSLLIGVNNQYRGRDAEEYRAEFRRLLQRAIAFAGGDPKNVIVVSIPDWGVTPFAEGRDRAKIAREIDQFNAISREEASKERAWYVDIAPGSRRASSDSSLIADDKLHPSGVMYREWAAAVLDPATDALR